MNDPLFRPPNPPEPVNEFQAEKTGKSFSIAGARQSELDVARGRLSFASLIFFLGYMLLGARLVDVSIVQGALRSLAGAEAEPRQQKTLPPAGAPGSLPRADIVDRNGVLLATSLETASLYADPAMILEPEVVARRLSEILPGQNYGNLLEKLQKKSRFVWIKRNLTPEEQYAVLRIGSPGLAFTTEYRRIYPQGGMMAHFVGYTNIDGEGLGGVERSFNNYLQASAGPLRLTLDVRLQHILRREVSRAIAEFTGIGGSGVIMDVKTGEVLAAVSLPDFDPHAPEAVKEQNPMFNRLTLGVYELGSIFKIFSTAAYLELNGGNFSDTFDATKPIQRGRFRITDYHPEKRVLHVPEIFMVSSNIGSALMGEAVGAEALRGFYADLGLLGTVPVEIEEKAPPLVPRPWGSLSTLTASYGHGIAVTPLQMVAAASTIVNGGTLVHPTLILKDGAEKSPQKSPELRIVSPETSHRMNQLLRLVVTEGTGKMANVDGYNVGGKTGTAEKPGARGGDDKKRLISSFMGFFPMNDPRYAVFVMVDEPHGNKQSYGYATAGWVGAPPVARIVSSMASVLGLEPEPEGESDMLTAPLQQYIYDPRKAAEARAAVTAGGAHATY